MKINYDNLKELFEKFDLCLFYDSQTKQNVISTTPDIDNVKNPITTLPADPVNPIVINKDQTDDKDPNHETEENPDSSTDNKDQTDEKDENQGTEITPGTPTGDVSTQSGITTLPLPAANPVIITKDVIIQTVTSTKVYKVPFTLANTDDAIALEVMTKDLPNIIIEEIKLCKDNKEYIIFDKQTVIALNDIIREGKRARSVTLSIAGSTGTRYGI